MEKWKRLEFDYAAKLRSADAHTRRSLYAAAYSEVGKYRVFRSSDPEDRTAGTSKDLVSQLRQFLKPTDRVLEIGCGRGYTCMMLAPHVRSIVGTEVSEPALVEAREVLAQRGIGNAHIVDISALDLVDRLPGQRFDAAISIDVVEHLHPDDTTEHLCQVFQLLEPGGRYIICMPNRLDGPHDITREEFPSAKAAMGFHLNESTYGDIVRTMRDIGFSTFHSFRPFAGRTIVMPAAINVAFEAIYSRIGTSLAAEFFSIRLIAGRP